jgi:hypothetical protein
VEVTVSARNETLSSTDGGGGSCRKSKNGAKFEENRLQIDSTVQVGEILFFFFTDTDTVTATGVFWLLHWIFSEIKNFILLLWAT